MVSMIIQFRFTPWKVCVEENSLSKVGLFSGSMLISSHVYEWMMWMLLCTSTFMQTQSQQEADERPGPFVAFLVDCTKAAPCKVTGIKK